MSCAATSTTILSSRACVCVVLVARRITELLGVLVELYLMMTSCLPSTSLLFQKHKQFAISPFQKVLLEIMYLQLFTFPLLSWGELKPEITLILKRTVGREVRCRIGSASPSERGLLGSLLHLRHERTQHRPHGARVEALRHAAIQHDPLLPTETGQSGIGTQHFVGHAAIVPSSPSSPSASSPRW